MYEPTITYSSNPEPELFISILIITIAVVVGLLVGTAISAVLCYFVSSWLKEVPEEDRVMNPGKVWLLLIPLFNFYWMFRVYMLDIPKSFKNYFDRKADRLVGDCGKNLGLWLCICTLGSLIPLLGSLVSIAGLVLYVLWLVKIHQLKNKIIANRISVSQA